MSNEKLYRADEVCKELNISSYTISNWYNWERKQLKGGVVDKPYLPKPIRMEHTKGSPRCWTYAMIEELRNFQKTIVTGRNGIYGVYSNPYYKDTKKYKNSVNSVENV